MGGCYNYGPVLGTLNIRGRIIIGTQKGTIILTTGHILSLHTQSSSGECCLVLPPDVRVTLLRDAFISVQYLDVQGHLHTQELDGEVARALQHELDHLNGILILDHATDETDLDSQIFPTLKELEAKEHSARQQMAFERMVSS